MPALGTYAENAVINALLRNSPITWATLWYVALYTSNPTATDVGTEVSTSGGSNYVRQSITFGAPASGVSSSVVDVSFPVAGTNWGNITHAAIRDATSAGNLLFYGTLVLPRNISTGDVLKFLTGNVSITVN